MTSYIVSADPLENDSIFWGPNPSGIFSTKSAMAIVRKQGAQPPVLHFNWGTVWKIPAQQRVRNFIFLLLHGCLMCNYNRYRRHLASSAACPRCNMEETELHLLRDCNQIRLVWLAIYVYWCCKDQLSLNGAAPSVSNTGLIKSWIPPPPGWTKLNVDGISKGNPGIGGGGGLFRNHEGIFLHGFNFKCGTCTTLRAELWALLYGIKERLSIGITHLLIESDSLVAVSLLKASLPIAHPDLNLIRHCKQLLDDANLEFRIAHVPRGANTAADRLANLSSTSNSSFNFFDIPPVSLASILSEDSAIVM